MQELIMQKHELLCALQQRKDVADSLKKSKADDPLKHILSKFIVNADNDNLQRQCLQVAAPCWAQLSR